MCSSLSVSRVAVSVMLSQEKLMHGEWLSMCWSKEEGRERKNECNQISKLGEELFNNTIF